MEQIMKVKPNQSFLDIILQGCGTMERGMQVAIDNGLPLSYLPIVNSKIAISDTARVESNFAVLKYLRQNEIVIGTRGGVSISGLLTEDSDDIVTEDEIDRLIEES